MQSNTTAGNWRPSESVWLSQHRLQAEEKTSRSEVGPTNATKRKEEPLKREVKQTLAPAVSGV